MTVKDYQESAASKHMAKRQKTDSVAKDVQDPSGATSDTPSELMIGLIGAATRAPDMNIVDFSDDISDIEISPGEKPLSDSDIPPRPEKEKKKKKNHEKGEYSKKHPADDEISQKKDGQSTATNTGATTKS